MFGPYDILKRFFPEELNRVRSTVIIPEVKRIHKPIQQMLKRSSLDLTKPVDQIIMEIIQNNIETA